jgi:hypothetical protein
MPEFLDVGKLQDQTQKYQDAIHDIPKEEDKDTIIKQIKELFDPELKSIVITNYSKTRVLSKIFYVMKIERDRIELAEKSETMKNYINYDYQSNEITLNNKPMSQIYFQEFKKRINRILEDIDRNKARVFEEHEENLL